MVTRRELNIWSSICISRIERIARISRGFLYLFVYNVKAFVLRHLFYHSVIHSSPYLIASLLYWGRRLSKEHFRVYVGTRLCTHVYDSIDSESYNDRSYQEDMEEHLDKKRCADSFCVHICFVIGYYRFLLLVERYLHYLIVFYEY